MRAFTASGDNVVIKSLCDDNGKVGFNCSTIVIMILSLVGTDENLAPVCKAGVPSALVRYGTGPFDPERLFFMKRTVLLILQRRFCFADDILIVKEQIALKGLISQKIDA